MATAPSVAVANALARTNKSWPYDSADALPAGLPLVTAVMRLSRCNHGTWSST